MKLLWIDQGDTAADTHVAFRGMFQLDRRGEVELRTLGASWFVVWLDGAYLTEGPARYHPDHPEYTSLPIKLASGRHVLAVQVNYVGADTRMLQDIRPFLACEVHHGGRETPVAWKCTRLEAYAPRVRRINPQLGWMEWCDTAGLPRDWPAVDFDDSEWGAPVEVTRPIGDPRPTALGPVRQFVHALVPIASGELVETFRYPLDDPPVRFFLRELASEDLPAQGVWRRYDLGRVRLGRLRLRLDLPAGAEVEIAASEALAHGRVPPWIPLSTGPSCNMDHYVARGGVQAFFALTPKGGRFVEVHVIADPQQVRFVDEVFVERCYYDSPEGAFTCGDERLDRTWRVGIETLRACAEDAIIDNPTRERGQWVGDSVTVGMEIAAAGWADLRPLGRDLVQAAQSARGDGLVAGLCPGGILHVPSFAMLWTEACVRYHQLSGDGSLLEALFPSAERNVRAMEQSVRDGWLTNEVGWPFIDWGYVPSSGPADVPLNLHYLNALRSMTRWCELLGRGEERQRYDGMAERLAWLVAGAVGRDWDEIGLHAAALAMRAGVVPSGREVDCIRFIKTFLLDCFPNRREAPRLSDPTLPGGRIMTPFFMQFVFPSLIEGGEMDFVLEQYRTCWGWMLDNGWTTWLEVFDRRSTHCHHWSGCPTWQLSRYVLGMQPRFDIAADCFDLRLYCGSMESAGGRVPLPGGRPVEVSWRREGGGIRYHLKSPQRLRLRVHGRGGVDEAAVAGEATLDVEPLG